MTMPLLDTMISYYMSIDDAQQRLAAVYITEQLTKIVSAD